MASTVHRHTRSDVLDAALRVLDRHGLPDLTMRSLGAELGVHPGAIYWHFPNKQALLAALADRMTDQLTLPAEGSWEEQTRQVAGQLRNALFAHRDGAELVASSDALGLGGRAPLEMFTSLFGQAGLPRDAAAAAAAALLHFCLGALQREQQRAQATALGVDVADDPLFQYNPSEYGMSTSAGSDRDGEYAFGVDLIVTGVRVAAQRLSELR